MARKTRTKDHVKWKTLGKRLHLYHLLYFESMPRTSNYAQSDFECKVVPKIFDNAIQTGFKNALKWGIYHENLASCFWDMVTLTCKFWEPWNKNIFKLGFEWCWLWICDYFFDLVALSGVWIGYLALLWQPWNYVYFLINILSLWDPRYMFLIGF